MEVPGEDPLTTGEYGARFVQAMQARGADGSQRVVNSNCCNAPKHWLNYDTEGRHDAMNQDYPFPDRNDFNAEVTPQEQTEYYLAQWHATMAIGQPGGVMCSTNRINGIDACMNGLFCGILRKQFKLSGFVLTDGNSCSNANNRATVALKNASAAAAWGTVGHEIAAELCINAGTDMELGNMLLQYTAGAVAAGRVKPKDIARSNARIYAQIIAQGHFEDVPDDKLGPESVDTKHNRQIAYEAATQAMVLLNNDGAILPLRKRFKVALVGPHLNSTTDLLASHGYAGQSKLVLQNTIEMAFKRRAAAGDIEIVGTAGGCNIVTGYNTSDLASVEAAVASADVVLAFVGLHPSTGGKVGAPVGYGTQCSEGEAWGRGCDKDHPGCASLDLCGQQPQILQAAIKAGKPLVTVLINGGQISATWIKEHSAAARGVVSGTNRWRGSGECRARPVGCRSRCAALRSCYRGT